MAEDRCDVLVIGGGITGVGIALDAASRGLSVALVEKDDFAAGTSGRSSRLVHGGLRYLEHGEFGLVRESLRERGILLRLAPHLVPRQLIRLHQLIRLRQLTLATSANPARPANSGQASCFRNAVRTTVRHTGPGPTRERFHKLG